MSKNITLQLGGIHPDHFDLMVTTLGWKPTITKTNETLTPIAEVQEGDETRPHYIQDGETEFDLVEDTENVYVITKEEVPNPVTVDEFITQDIFQHYIAKRLLPIVKNYAMQQVNEQLDAQRKQAEQQVDEQINTHFTIQAKVDENT